MRRSPEELRNDALAIWRAGVDAVRSDRLVQQQIRVKDGQLIVGDQKMALDKVGRIAVVGCGKAGAGMAEGCEAALGQRILVDKAVTGWINVPDDCVRTLTRLHLHGARPPGVNEPTEAGVEGARRILEIVRDLTPDDLCICLMSGGGSALLPAPVEAITLEDKLAVTRHLSGAGANIKQLNTVRKQLSRIKGGGLARECQAGRLISLIISDVLGDPLDVIASGPTVPDTSSPAEALAVLDDFNAHEAGISEAVFRYLEYAASENAPALPSVPPIVTNRIIGNNATAVQAAVQEARRFGYEAQEDVVDQLEGEAEAVGQRLVERAVEMRRRGSPACLVSGGEPTVRLVPSQQRGMGGRNQQLVLAALQRLLSHSDEHGRDLVLLSGGTDGEDGPTDAAGAWLDATLVQRMRAARLSPEPFLSRNDAYHFFDRLDGLIRTGPTHTNVCDLRVVLCDASSS